MWISGDKRKENERKVKNDIKIEGTGEIKGKRWKKVRESVNIKKMI